jgi:murein DD-endopeptidase MepM/ murein hydrolase activator NlpD
MTKTCYLRRLLIILCTLVVITIITSAQDADSTTTTPPAAPSPVTTYTLDDLTGEVYFSTLQQGGVGLVRLVPEPNSAPEMAIRDARAYLREREYRFVQVLGDAWYALIVGDIDAQAREYVLSVLIQRENESIDAFEAPILLESAGYIRQSFTVGGELAYLADPVVERQEFARLDALRAEVTAQRLWDANGFQLPIEAEFVAPFGNYRILNGNVQTRHTGWDQRAVPGTPVGTIAAGRVVFSGRLDIRGNYVMLDHGWGVYSGYAHFSQINVERGQTVEAGEIIGLSGNTGRSIGPHLHWEVSVHGEWVDGRAFINMWLPT